VDEGLLRRLLGAVRGHSWWPAAAAAGFLVAAGAAWFLSSRVPEPLPRPVPPPLAVKVPAPLIDLPPTPAPVSVSAPVVEAPVPVPQPKPVLPEPGFVPATPVVPSPKPVVPAVTEAPRVESPKVPSPATTTDYAKIFAPVVAAEPAGDLFVRRGRAEAAKSGPVELLTWEDALAAPGGGGCSVDGRATLALERGAEAGVMVFRPDDAYRLVLGRGAVMIDTEGTSQRWQVVGAGGQVELRDFNGRACVEPRGEGLAALLLEGRGEVVAGGAARWAQPGREVVLSREGTVTEQKADPRARIARLVELRPKASTAFAASFDERKDEVTAYPYALLAGKLVAGPTGFHVMADRVPIPGSRTDQATLQAAIRPSRPFPAASGMLLRFRYRTNLSKVTLTLGRHAVEFVPKARPGQWGDAELPLGAFSFEGTPMIPSEPIEELRFSGAGAVSTGQLDVDGVHFLRRVR
jgi:hypothetical protein